MKNFSLQMKPIFIEIQRNPITLKPRIKIMYIILYTYTCSFFKVIALMFPNIANEPSIFRYPKIDPVRCKHRFDFQILQMI